MSLITRFVFLLLFLIMQFTSLTQVVSVPKRNSLGNQVIKLNTSADSLQYAVGIYVGQWMNNNGLFVPLSNFFIEGIKDGLNNNSRIMSDSLVSKLVQDYQVTGLGEKGRRQEQALFNSLKDQPNIGMLPNGVKYLILKKGKGMLPEETDTLTLNILAKLPDNTVLENTYQTKQPVLNTPNNFFPGLKESLLMMTEGSKWQVYIPAKLAFGEKGSMPRIPPNSALIIEVEIVAINKSN